MSVREERKEMPRIQPKEEKGVRFEVDEELDPMYLKQRSEIVSPQFSSQSSSCNIVEIAPKGFRPKPMKFKLAPPVR